MTVLFESFCKQAAIKLRIRCNHLRCFWAYNPTIFNLWYFC